MVELHEVGGEGLDGLRSMKLALGMLVLLGPFWDPWIDGEGITSWSFPVSLSDSWLSLLSFYSF